MFTKPTLDIHPEVADALKNKKPVVALASSPLTHTIPYPANLETYRQVAAAARQEGAALAMIAVWQGRLKVGLTESEAETLARGGKFVRATRRDLAPAILRGHTGGTTVSASMYIAWRAGIRLLATGAIGGATHSVVRNEHSPWDISADLVELLHTPVAVVSAGARSVYNKAYTAEVLETFRIPVIGYGTDAFPTFYMRAGSYPASTRADTASDVAAMLSMHWDLDGAGVVVAQLTPLDAALSPDELLPALVAVEEQAEKDGVARKDLSPFLMDKLNRLTRGKALRAYQAILVENILLGARISRELLK
jgi:pseudouridine-5'-phosphate glycosidase